MATFPEISQGTFSENALTLSKNIIAPMELDHVSLIYDCNNNRCTKII